MIYGYARVSTVEQSGDRSSLGDQERRIMGAAMIRGEAAPRMFVDPGISGSTPLASRPAGGELVQLLQPGDTIIAAKLDRLFRSASDALVTVEQFQKRGVDVILVDMGIDPVTSSGVSKLFFTMLAAFAEFERGRIVERANDGRKGKRRRGGHIGGKAPYGYRIVGAGRDAMLEVDPLEQVAVALAREARAAGLSLRAVADSLATRGKMNRDGKRFDATQIKRLLEFDPRGTVAA